MRNRQPQKAGPNSSPVEFDPFTIHREDPYQYLASARQTRPVFYSKRLESWCITRYDDIERVIRDGDLFSSHDHNPQPPSTLSPELRHALATWRGEALPMGSIDGSEHTRIRAVAGRGFTPRALSGYKNEISEVADNLLDQLVAEPSFDFIARFAYPFPLTVILTVLGVPLEYHDKCRDWTELRVAVLLPRKSPDQEVQRRCLEGLREFIAMSRAIVADRLREPREDLISYMLHSEVRGHAMTPGEVVAQIPTLVSAGHETTAQGLATIVHRLLDTPDGWSQLVGRQLDVEILVEESLRHDGPIAGFYRTVTRDCEIAGVHLTRGSRIFLAYGSGSRDEAVFADPDTFSTARANARSHLAFGGGPHHCIGAALARMELVIALEKLAERFPRLALAPDQDVHHLDRFPLRALSDFTVLSHDEQPGVKDNENG
ncbi:cytochrome P450 [Streptomyces sp. NPDC048663]|uniref:cytochrome P450 n=1 Tax=Streptomyces sp. NPDC048663 TaxID=3155638 RepID=UPI003427F019